MAKETQEKRYRVSLSSSFSRPQFKGRPKTGVIYLRGGYAWHAEDGEGKSYHILSYEELDKLKIAKNIQFTGGPVEHEIDKNLYVEEVR